MVHQQNGEHIILHINQAFLDNDDNQFEALLQPHQACAFGVAMNDAVKHHTDKHGNPGG